MVDDWVIPEVTLPSNDDWVVPTEPAQETGIVDSISNAFVDIPNTVYEGMDAISSGLGATLDNRSEIASTINRAMQSAGDSALGYVGRRASDVNKLVGYDGKDLITDAVNHYAQKREPINSEKFMAAQNRLRDAENAQNLTEGGALVREVFTGATKMIPSLTMGGGTGSVVTGLAAMLPQVFGENVEALKASGESPDSAVGHGAVKSGIEVGSELLPLKYLLKAMPSQYKKILSVTVAEGGTEMASSLMNSLYDSFTTNPNMTWDQAWAEAKHAGLVGSLTGGVVAGAVSAPNVVSSGINKVNESMNTRKETASIQDSLTNIATNREQQQIDTQQQQAAQDATLQDIQSSLADVRVPQEPSVVPGANVQPYADNSSDYRHPDLTRAILQNNKTDIESRRDAENRTGQYQDGVSYPQDKVTPDGLDKATTTKSAAYYHYDNGIDYNKSEGVEYETPEQAKQKIKVDGIEYTPENIVDILRQSKATKKDIVEPDNTIDYKKENVSEIDNSKTEKAAPQKVFGNEIEFEPNNKGELAQEPVENTRERLTKKLGEMNHAQVKALAVDARIVRAKTDSKEELTIRIIALREAVDTLKQYETLNDVYTAIDAGDISKEQIAQWATAVSKKGSKISPINSHLNLASVTAWARSNAGLKLPFTQKENQSNYFEGKPDSTKAVNFSRPYRPKYLRKKRTKKFRDKMSEISSTIKGGSSLFPVDEKGNIKGFDHYRDAFKQMQKMDEKLKELDKAQAENPDTDPKQLLDLYEKSYNLWASIQNASFYHGDNVNKAIDEEMASRSKQNNAKTAQDTTSEDSNEEIERTVSEIIKKHVGSQLYSTPIEPIIKEFVALLRDTYGWGKKQITAFVDNIGEEGKDFIDTITSVTKVPKAVFHIAKVITMPNKHMLNGMYQSTGVQAFKDIHDALFATVGEDSKAVHDPYETAVDRRVTTNINKLATILKPFDNNKASLAQVVRLIRNPDNIIPGTTVHDAAKAIGELMAAEKTYQDEAGIEQGEILDGYFPRQLDLEVVRQRRHRFLRDATQAYLDTDSTLTHDEAATKAREWLVSAELGSVGVRRSGYDFVSMQTGMPKPNSSKGRTLSKEADTTLEAYFNNDPVDVLGSYFVSSARRSEFIKRFGTVPWKRIKADIIDNGHAEMLDEVVRIVESSTGIMPNNLPVWASNATSFLRVLTALTYLPHATITSLSELALPIVRSGDIRVLARNLITTTRELIKSSKNDELRDISEMILGVTGNISTEMLLAQRFGGQFDGKKAQKIMNKFFHKTGLHRFTEATRIGALQVSRTFMSGLAKDVVGNTSRKKSAEMLFKELGVPADKVAEFSATIQEHSNGIVGKESLEQEGWFSETYQQAMVRFTEQTIMNPKASERPIYANHPVGAFAYSLMSFLYSFHVNVLERSGKMAMAGVNVTNGLSVGDRARMMAPVLGLTLPMIIQFALGESKDRLREVVYGTNAKEKSDTDKWITAFSRAGLLGIADPVVNMVTGAKYNRDPATMMSGAVLGGMGTWIQSLMGVASGKNSKNTNTTERKFVKTSYELGVKPFINLVFTMMPGGTVLTPLAMGGIQAASAKGTSELVTDAFAGDKKKNGGSRNRRRPQRKRERRRKEHR